MRYFVPFYIVIVVLSLFVTEATAQRRPPGTECPGSRVIASAERVVDGENVTFLSEIFGGKVDRSLLKYNWTIDRGRIVSGQGGPVIVVDTTGQGPAGSVTATVDIEPYSYCEWVASDSTRVRRKGKLTKADVFWEWFFENSDQYYFYDSASRKYTTETFEELTSLLREVDPNLTFKILSKEPFGGPRTFSVGYGGNIYNAKVVNDFVARAPIMTYWKFVAAKPR